MRNSELKKRVDFSTPPSITNMSNRQKKNQSRELNTADNKASGHIQSTVSWRPRMCSLLKYTQDIFQAACISDHKISPNKFVKVEILTNYLY